MTKLPDPLCSHGLAGDCPDCPPARHTVGELRGARTAHVLDNRHGPWVVVRRYRQDGCCDWHTWHVTRRGARRAAGLYERTGRVRGLRP